MDLNFNLCIVAQAGRLKYEALLAVASLRATTHGMLPSVWICIPANNERWSSNPEIDDKNYINVLAGLDAKVVKFENERFGSRYPHSNKVYALKALPPDEAFIFFDSDHAFQRDLSSLNLDFEHPQARNAAKFWPRKLNIDATNATIWDALYSNAGLSTEHWYRENFPTTHNSHYPYFNGGCFYHKSAGEFWRCYRHLMHSISENPPEGVPPNHLFPSLDQIALAMVMNALGGSNDLLRGDFPPSTVAQHYFHLSNLIVRVDADYFELLKELIFDPRYRDIFAESEAYQRLFFEGGADEIRRMMSPNDKRQGNRQQMIKRLKKEGLWFK